MTCRFWSMSGEFFRNLLKLTSKCFHFKLLYGSATVATLTPKPVRGVN